MNLTLVAYYGDKPPLISALIHSAINELSNLLGSGFIPYDPEQIHGTIIGLEGHWSGTQLFNTNYKNLYHSSKEMNLKAALQILNEKSFLPFDVTFGGFIDGKLYPFTSRGLAPYLRSFSIQGRHAVAMGWPHCKGKYVESLDLLRRTFNNAYILHKYHCSPDAKDNDFFLVLGHIIKEKTDPTLLLESESRLRDFFSAYEPVNIPITRDCLRIVAYTDPTLAPDTSCAYTLDQAEEHLDAIKSLYPRNHLN